MTWREFVDSIPERVGSGNDDFARQLTAHYKRARDTIQSEIDRLYARALQGVEPNQFLAVSTRTGRLQRLQSQVLSSYERAATAAGADIERAARAAMSNTYYANQYALNRGVATAQGLALSFERLPAELVELAVRSTPEAWARIGQEAADKFGDITAYAAKHGTLTDMLQNRRAQDLRRVQETVIQAIIQGKNATQAARDLDRALSITRNNATRILRTETHRVQSAGHYAASEAAKAGGARIRRRVVAVLDDRTRPQSAAVDGDYENADGFFEYPGGTLVRVPGNSGIAGWDINDRETVIDEVAGLEPETRRVRNPATGKNEVISWANFRAWADGNGLRQNRYGQYL